MEEERAAKRRRYTSPIISIKVGADLTALTVHEDRLRQSSDYFKAALSKKWAEGQKHEIIFEAEDHDIVTTYVDYLYGASIPQDLPPSNVDSLLELANLYVFGEYIQDAKFCNAVMSVILHHIDVKDANKKCHCPSAKFIRVVYEGTAEGSPVRRLVVQLFADRAGRKWFEQGQEYPNEFLMDMAAELVERRGGPVKVRCQDLKGKWFKDI